MLTPLKRARVLFGSTTTQVHHYQTDQFIKSPHIWLFTICLLGHIGRVVPREELGDNCGGWLGAGWCPGPPAATSGHTGMWPRRPRDLDGQQPFLGSIIARLLHERPTPVFKKPDAGAAGE